MITTLGTMPNLLIKTKHLCNDFWRLKDSRLRCRICRRTLNPRKGLVKINRQILKKIIQEFILEHSTNIILARVNISKYKLLKILTLVRIAMSRNIPDVFVGIVEVDETYLGGQMKNRRQKDRLKYGKNAEGLEPLNSRSLAFSVGKERFTRKLCLIPKLKIWNQSLTSKSNGVQLSVPILGGLTPA